MNSKYAVNVNAFQDMDHDDADIPTIRLVFNGRKHIHIQKKIEPKFILGPIPYDWMKCANSLPGKAGTVGFSLWFLRGVKSSNTFAITAEANGLAACSRQAFARGLLALVDARLIEIKSRPGARPLVTLLCGFDNGKPAPS